MFIPPGTWISFDNHVCATTNNYNLKFAYHIYFVNRTCESGISFTEKTFIIKLNMV